MILNLNQDLVTIPFDLFNRRSIFSIHYTRNGRNRFASVPRKIYYYSVRFSLVGRYNTTTAVIVIAVSTSTTSTWKYSADRWLWTFVARASVERSQVSRSTAKDSVNETELGKKKPNCWKWPRLFFFPIRRRAVIIDNRFSVVYVVSLPQ